MVKRRTIVQASLAAAFVAALAVSTELATWDMGIGPMDAAGWRPIAWPFPPDGFPSGRAWRGHGLEVYVRPKLGFFDRCDTRVSSDEEIDRATDIALLDPHFAPLREGGRVRITDLFGRTRLYSVKGKGRSTRQAEAIAVTYMCHLVTALVVGDAGDETARRTAHRFIESNTVQVWLNQALGSR